MKLNKLTFIINSTGQFINTYRPNIKSRTSHTNIIQVIAPVSPLVNILVSYDRPHIVRQPLTEFMAISNLKGKDVLDMTNPELNAYADWNVWELTLSERANELILTNRPTKLNITFNFIDYNITDTYSNTVDFGINKIDIPLTYLPDTLYINRMPNFYSTVFNKRLFEGQGFVTNDSQDGYVEAAVGELIFSTTPTSVTVEPSFRGDIPASVTPEGIDFNNVIDNHDSRIENLETGLAEVPPIPPIEITNGEEEEELYVSQIEVDHTNKHKLLITKRNLPVGGLLYFDTALDFPVEGRAGMMYLARFKEDDDKREEPYNAVYAWDDNTESYFMIQGGGAGGGPGAAGLTFVPDPIDAPRAFAVSLGAEIKVITRYEQTDMLPGFLTIKRGGVDVATRRLNLGVNEIDLTQYVRAGNNLITLVATDGESSRQIVYNIMAVSLVLSTIFDDAIASTDGDFTIQYRVETEAEQAQVYFKLNDNPIEEITVTQTTNIKNITNLPHGVHTLEIQAKIEVDNTDVYTDKLILKLIAAVDNSPVLIASGFNKEEITQGERNRIDYIVYSKQNEFKNVTLKVNNNVVASLNVGNGRQYWDISNLDIGLYTLKIESSGVSKEFTIDVLAPDITFLNNEVGLITYFTAVGRTNLDSNKGLWLDKFGSTPDAVLNDFNYASNGWIDGSLLLNGLANVVIPYKPFENPIGQSGFTFEVEFETLERSESPFIECWYNNRGFKILSDRAIFKSSNTSSEVFFKEQEKTKLSLVVDKLNNLALVYINGVLSGVEHTNNQTSFQQSSPEFIKINENLVDGKLYNIRVYNRALSNQEILDNYLFDIVDYSEKLQEYLFSDVLTPAGNPDLDKVRAKMPVMIIRTYGKDEYGNSLPQTADSRPYVTVNYQHHLEFNKNFNINNVRIRTQGTSSLNYPFKNYRLYDGDLLVNPVTLNNEMRPAHRINLKADYVDSSQATNVAIARMFNNIMSVPTPPKAEDGKSRISIWSEGPTAVFEDNGSTTKFVGVYNLNGDKSDSEIWGFYDEMNFPDARRYEILFNAGGHAVSFVKPNNISSENWAEQLYDGFEQHWPKTPSGGDFEDLDFNNPTDNQLIKSNYTQLKEFVEFISDADLDTPEGISDFRTEFASRANVEYFIKTLITIFVFGLVDNFGKDLMLVAWEKATGEDYLKWFTSLYDLDTAIGIDNQGRMTNAEGELLYDYDIEMGDSGVFAQAESKLWEAVIKAFPAEIENYYDDLRSDNYSYVNIWDNLYVKQIATISKAIYNASNEAKYITSTGASEWSWMLNGDRLTQINRWIRNRLTFLDSKYNYNIDNKTITARFDIDDTDNFELELITNTHLWINAQLSNQSGGLMRERATAFEPVTVNHSLPSQALPLVEFSLYNADKIVEWTNLKDLPLLRLQLGDADALEILDLERDNPDSTLNVFSLGENRRLKYVNLKNNSAITGVLDFSLATNLEYLNLEGTGVTSVILPIGGVLKELYLPDTIINLEIKNQGYLETIELADGTELETLVLENTNLDFRDLLEYVEENGRVRILGVEMSVYGEDFLIELKENLEDLKGIDANNNYIDNPSVQGVIKVLGTQNVDPTILNWYAVTLRDLDLEVNIMLDGLTFIDKGDYFEVSGYSQNTSGLISITSSVHAGLSPENNIIFGIDGWKPVTKIGPNAFASKNFTEILLPRQIEEIGINAFSGANKFKEVFLPDSLITVGKDVFKNNHNELIILTEPSSKPVGWDIDWNSGDSLVIWNAKESPTLFTFDTKGGNIVTSISTRILRTLPEVTKFGYDGTGWEYDGSPVSLPVVPTKSDPSTYELEVAGWTPWIYEAKFLLPDNSIYETLYITFGDSLGLDFADIDKGGNNQPTYENQGFRGWKDSEGTKVTHNYIIEQDKTIDGLEVIFRAMFLDTQGLVFTYDSNANVYDVTAFSLTNTSMPNGSINLFVPATFDDGINGDAEVRHVKPDSSNPTHKNKIGSIEIEGNSLMNREYGTGSQNTNFVNMISVIIPEGFIKLNINAFRNCSSLTEITIPESVTSVGMSAFYNCSSLTEITIPESVTSISDYVFYNCSSLTEITIPESVTEINPKAFDGCSSLTEITIERKNVPTSYFHQGQFATGAITVFNFTKTQSNINVLDGGKLIVNAAKTVIYTYPGAVGNVDLSILTPNITSIGNYAFYNCSSLTEITIPESVTSIVASAFLNCSSLTEITIPESVTSINRYAFSGCSSLETVNVLPTTPPTVITNSFNNNAPGRTFYVPTGLKSTYVSASNWAHYQNDIEEVI